MPEYIFRKIKDNIGIQLKVCFLTALIVGLIAHFYKITNWLPNWDSLVFRYDSQNMLGLGRWFLPVACSVSSFYDLPWITGLMAVILNSFAAVVVCRIFDIRKNVTAALTGAVIASFPTVTSVMLYNYVADGYSLAFLMSCVAALFMTGKNKHYIAAMVMIALSSGIYQAYITVTVMLVLCYMISELVYKNADIKNIMTKGIKCFLTGACAMVLYYVILNVLLKVTGTELMEYQGLDSAASLSAIDIKGSIYVIWNSFCNYFFDFSDGLSVYNVVNVIIFIFVIALYFFAVIKNKLSLSKIVTVIALAALLPVGASVLAIINSKIDYHNLMKMGFFVFYMFFVLLYDNEDFTYETLNCIKSWAVLVLSAVLIINNVITANVSYHMLQIAYEKSYATLIRIADRIEQTDGSENCDEVLIVGSLPGSEAYSVKFPPDITGTTEGYIIRFDDEIVGQSVVCSALNDYCGKDYKFLAGTRKDEFMKANDISGMDYWPGKNSVSVTDNVIVVNLGAEREG